MLNVFDGDVIEGEVADFASDGEGVVKIGSYAVFVPFAIKGEKIRARIRHAKKDYAFGELIEVVEPSEHRIKPKCPYYGRCGGCDLQHADRDCQLLIKKNCVENALKKSGITVNVNDVVRLNDWEYRNKISLPFGYKSKSGRVTLGFYEKRTHSVVPMKWCALHGEWASTLIADVTDWANAYSVDVYDETKRKGLLRHLVARMLDTLTVTLVINGDRVPKLAELTQRLERDFPGVTLFLSENRKNTNVIFGDETRLVYGKERKQNLGAYDAIVSPLSFLQVNNDVRDEIYARVCKALDGFDGNVVELYSGVGLLTAQLALRMPSARITAVEIVPSATKNADALMKTLGLSDRVENVCADAVEYMKKLPCESEPNLPDEILSSPYYLGENRAKARALILDPPRKGCEQEVLKAALQAGFERVVYVSCNPQTLARDLQLLSEGYDVCEVTPFDMFPQTANVEVLTILQKRQTK